VTRSNSRSRPRRVSDLFITNDARLSRVVAQESIHFTVWIGRPCSVNLVEWMHASPRYLLVLSASVLRRRPFYHPALYPLLSPAIKGIPGSVDDQVVR